MHQVKLPLQDEKRNEVINSLSNQGYSVEEASGKLIQSADTALSIAIVAFDFMSVIYKLPKRNWVKAWNQNTILLRYFGEIKHPRELRKAMRRIDSVKQRLIDGVMIELEPQPNNFGFKKGWSFLTAKSAKTFANDISNCENDLGASIVHKLMGLKLSDQSADQVTYGEQLAIDVAISEPFNARRNLRVLNSLY